MRLRCVTEVTFRGRRSTLCALDVWTRKDSWQAQGIGRSHKSVPQQCPTRVSYKSVPQELPTTVSHKSAPQECPTRVSYRSIPQECPTRVSHKSFLLECPTRVSHKSVLQECHLDICSFLNVFAFGFVGSILFFLSLSLSLSASLISCPVLDSTRTQAQLMM